MLWDVKRTLAAGAAVVVSLLLVVALPGVAAAHNQLVSSTPTNNQVLTTPPSAIILTFEEPSVPDSTKMAATSSDGAVVALVTPKMTGAKQSAAWPANTPDGTYTVSWRSAADDGHVMSGTFAFSYTGASPSPTSTSGPVAGPGTQPAQPAQPGSTSGSSTDGGINWLWPAYFVVGILVLATAAGIILRRIRKQDESQT